MPPPTAFLPHETAGNWPAGAEWIMMALAIRRGRQAQGKTKAEDL